MTFEQAWDAYNAQHDYVIDTRSQGWITLARGFTTIGRYSTFASALAAFVQEVL